MRGILIDPVEKTVTEIETAGDLDALYALLDCTTVERVSLGAGQDLWIDEEGLLKDEPGPFFAFEHNDDRPLCGRGVVLSHDGGGDTIGTKLALEAIENLIVWPDIEFVGLEPYESETEWFGEKTAVIGSRAIYRKKGGGE